MLAEDVALDDSGLGGFGEVACARWGDGVAVVGLAIFGYEADETLVVVVLVVFDVEFIHRSDIHTE